MRVIPEFGSGFRIFITSQYIRCTNVTFLKMSFCTLCGLLRFSRQITGLHRTQHFKRLTTHTSPYSLAKLYPRSDQNFLEVEKIKVIFPIFYVNYVERCDHRSYACSLYLFLRAVIWMVKSFLCCYIKVIKKILKLFTTC